MNAEVFVDTNIVLYAIDQDPASAAKRERAQKLLTPPCQVLPISFATR